MKKLNVCAKILLKQACGIAIVSAALTSLATAATINWGTAQQIGGSNGDQAANDREISTAGLLLTAIDFGNTGAAVTVNGVTFATDPNIFTPGPAGKYDGFGSSSANTPFTVYLSASYQNLLSTGIYGGPGSATFTGLTLGDTYEVQLWCNDSRQNTRSGAPPVTYQSDNPGVALSVNTFSDGTNNFEGGLGSYVIGTFTADATSFVLSTASDNRTLSALQIRDLGVVPEPSTTGLLGAGLLGLVLFVRRASFRSAV